MKRQKPPLIAKCGVHHYGFFFMRTDIFPTHCPYSFFGRNYAEAKIVSMPTDTRKDLLWESLFASNTTGLQVEEKGGYKNEQPDGEEETLSNERHQSGVSTTNQQVRMCQQNVQGMHSSFKERILLAQQTTFVYIWWVKITVPRNILTVEVRWYRDGVNLRQIPQREL